MPATMLSPAPTLLRTATVGDRIRSQPEPVARSTPAAPSETTTASH